ncbi:hypothetical protein D3C84_206280 [compost metagenome]
MGESGGIDQDKVDTFAFCGMNALDQLVLGIALQVEQMMTRLAGAALQIEVDLFQGGGAIDARLAGAQQVEVGAVQHQ